jgi:hypothetical protein
MRLFCNDNPCNAIDIGQLQPGFCNLIASWFLTMVDSMQSTDLPSVSVTIIELKEASGSLSR